MSCCSRSSFLAFYEFFNCFNLFAETRLWFTREIHACNDLGQLGRRIVSINGDRGRYMLVAKVLAYGFDLFPILASFEGQIDREMAEGVRLEVWKTRLLGSFF